MVDGSYLEGLRGAMEALREDRKVRGRWFGQLCRCIIRGVGRGLRGAKLGDGS